MDAMILAAGLGTRLRPLTEERPKALVEVGGTAMLERVARRLVAAGADRLIINTHPFADRVRAFVEQKDGFGGEVRFSHEAGRPLETGGGLKRAAPLFRKEAPFFLHNVDVWTDLDLKALYAAHTEGGALITLAVRPAETHRYLLFDAEGRLCGYGRRADGEPVRVRAPQGAQGTIRRLDFCGVHVIDPRLFALMTETGAFSIITTYLRLAREGHRITCFPTDDACADIGTPERLAAARRRAGSS